MRHPPLPPLLTFLGILGSAPSVARALPEDDRSTAEELFEEGRAFVERGDFADACPKFAESLRHDPGLGTMLWLADCYASNGQAASAWAEFKLAAAEAARRNDPREKVAREKADEFEHRLSRLTVIVPAAADVEGLDVRQDGVRLGRAEWGIAMALDGGMHTLSASAPGRRRWSTSVELPAGPTILTVSVPVLEVLEKRSSWDAQRALGIGLAGAGAAGIVVGAVFSLEAKSTYDKSNSGPCSPNNVCAQAGLDERSSARSTASAATLAMGLGATALAAGAVIFFSAPKRVPALTGTANAWSNGASLTLSGTF